VFHLFSNGFHDYPIFSIQSDPEDIIQKLFFSFKAVSIFISFYLSFKSIWLYFRCWKPIWVE